MSRRGARWRRAGLVAVALLLDACAGHHAGFGGHGGDGGDGGDGAVHAFPDNYRSDILAAMHAYLNDPTGIRDAVIAAPVLKDVAGGTRYVVCLRFNGKQSNGGYAGDQQIAAVFLAGRFDDFLDAVAAKEPCSGSAYTPFPELEQLKH
jgi:hypothetical protein